MGTIAAGALAGSTTKIIGKLVGSTLTNALKKKKNISAKRLYAIHEQREFDFDGIPQVYGSVKIAGTILWHSDITEHIREINTKSERRADYKYTVSLVIGVCEGPISSLEKIWADDILITDLQNINIYRGTEEQEVDPYLENVFGQQCTPTLKGIAYVVIQDFDIARFNNRIPNFTFEISRHSIDQNAIENLLESIVIIPGCGEFVYDTKIQYGKNHSGQAAPINQHHTPGIANSVVSTKQLKSALPNVKWAAPVVSWFGTDLDIARCDIYPAVEHREEVSEEWKVANFNRDNAYLISMDNGNPNYGGTPTDQSILRYLDYLKEQKLKVMFYPMLLMDCDGKPWRGRLSGSAEDVKEFFRKHNGYRNFILHYANLVKGRVDAFLIGSEMVSLTKIRDDIGRYPVIDEFIELAKEVKDILGPDVRISYAANWDEYHHDEHGYHHLDKLWACDAIDFIGIDAYFPLTEGNKSEHNVEKLINGWNSGEGYDFYLDGDKKIPLSPEHAWKNIEFWWSNKHFNPDGSESEWIPKSKKIWFTEYGFASVSCTTNEPNVFVDDSTSESNLPKNSSGDIDVLVQRAAIQATEMKWQNSEMVERKFLWTWDARPYPVWPDMKRIWSDGGSWQKGHWINGKVGVIELSTVVKDLCLRVGFTSDDIDTSDLVGIVRGLVIDGKQSARQIIENLQKIYDFEVSEVNGRIKFTSTYLKHKIEYDNLVDEGNDSPLKIEMRDISASSGKVTLDYLTQKFEVKRCSLGANGKCLEVELPLVLSDEEARHIANRLVLDEDNKNTIYEFSLPYILAKNITVNSILNLEYKSASHLFKVSSLKIREDKSVEFICTKFVETKQKQIGIPTIDFNCDEEILLPLTRLEVFKMQEKNKIGIAACGYSKKWHGCHFTYRLYKGGIKVKEKTEAILKSSVIGTIESYNDNRQDHFTIDRSSQFVVRLHGGQIYSIPEDEMFLTNRNLALLGTEIVKFSNAKLQSDGTYVISGLLRRLDGTKTDSYDRFVLLNDEVLQINLDNGVDRIEFEHKTFLDKLGIGLTSTSKTKSLELMKNFLSPTDLRIEDGYLKWDLITEAYEEASGKSFVVRFSTQEGMYQLFTDEKSVEIPSFIKNSKYSASVAVFHENRIASQFSILDSN